jgi:hypothetical protein
MFNCIRVVCIKQISKQICNAACPRNSVTPLRFCSFYFDHNSEMEGCRELSDVLNRREICLEDFETCPSS